MNAPEAGRRFLTRLRPHWPLVPGLLVAALLRFWNLLPAFFFGDEAEYAEVARSLANNPLDLAYPAIEGFGPAPFVSQPPLVLYLFALGTAATGDAEAGPLIVSALLGTATVALVYAIGVKLRGRAMGGIAALMFAVLPFHVGLSRGAQLEAGFTFFFTLTMLLFLVWLERPTARTALLAGVAAAATALSKLTGILVFGPLAAVLAFLLWTQWRMWRHTRDPDDRAKVARTTRMAGFAALPSAVGAFAYLLLLWFLSATVNLFQKLGWQAARVGGGASETGNLHRHWHWYFSDEQVGLPQQLGIILLVTAVAGLWLLLWRLWRRADHRPQILLAITWPLLVLVFFLLSDRKEWFYLMPAIPGVVLWAAWAVEAARLAVLRRLAPKPAPFDETGLPASDPRRSLVPSAIVVGLLLVAGCAAPARASVEERVLDGGTYGYGVEEAAEWIHRTDPAAAQAATTLGRFSLYFYNHQPTYHFYLNHTFIDEEIAAGRLRFVVIDDYLELGYEQEWMHRLVEEHDGKLVQEFHRGSGNSATRVYDLEA